jgi:hypothetical protein
VKEVEVAEEEAVGAWKGPRCSVRRGLTNILEVCAISHAVIYDLGSV